MLLFDEQLKLQFPWYLSIKGGKGKTGCGLQYSASVNIAHFCCLLFPVCIQTGLVYILNNAERVYPNVAQLAGSHYAYSVLECLRHG